MAHENPAVRRWAVRLLGDLHEISSNLEKPLAKLAASEKNAEVRSQLASTAKRLPGKASLPILAALWHHDGDVKDPHIPLLDVVGAGGEALNRPARRRPGICSTTASFLGMLPVDQFILGRLMQALGDGRRA